MDRFKLDRLSLADALAEQWEEMQRLATHAVGGEHAVAGEQGDPDGDPADGLPAEDELRVLLEEAQAARAELELKTDELGKRLAALEALVVGVHDALVELRGAEPKAADGNGEQRPGNGSAGNRRRSSRGAARRPASAVGGHAGTLSRGAAWARWPSRSSKPVRSCNPRLGRFDSGAAPLLRC